MIAMPNWPSVDYFASITIWHNQQNQATQNQQAHDAYVDAASNWLIQNESKLAYNQPLLAPLTPPKKVTYNDDGTQTLTDFPDLKPTVMPPAGVPSGPPANPNPPPNTTEAILIIVTQIWNKLNGG